MTVKIAQHFNHAFDSWSLQGNAALSTFHKFGSHSVVFPDFNSFVLVSNLSGCFNLSQDASAELECFFYPEIVLSVLDDPNNSVFIFNGHAYKLFRDTKSWDNAKSFCEALGGHLAVIRNEEENIFITDNFFNSGYNLWLGGFFDTSDNLWHWVDGSDWNFSSWAEDRPDNPSGNELFLELFNNQRGTWNDKNGSDSQYFICEWDSLYHASFALLGYRFFNGHSFKLFRYDSDISGNLAQSLCVSMNGHLATSTSPDKNSFLLFLLNGENALLGGSDFEHEGVWTWFNGDTWEYTNWHSGEPNNYQDGEHFLTLSSDGTWNDKASYTDYICEWDLDFRTLDFIPGNIFNFDDLLSLSVHFDGSLRLRSDSWNIDAFSNATLSTASWQHILLRFHDSHAYVYLNGALVLSTPFSGDVLSPEYFNLGGASGYIDEFILRDDALTASPVIPDRPYETILRNNSAPVSFALWSDNGLPDGLSLSSSGLLSGTPTIAGTYNCYVNVRTNWGSANKTIRIVIENGD